MKGPGLFTFHIWVSVMDKGTDKPTKSTLLLKKQINVNLDDGIVLIRRQKIPDTIYDYRILI